MAVQRDRPYTGFNFLVDLGDGNTEGPRAGFQEISGLGMEVTVVEYRNGNARDNNPIKLTGLSKVPDVTLKRGIIGTTDLYAWLGDGKERDYKSFVDSKVYLYDVAAKQAAEVGKVALLERPEPAGDQGVNRHETKVTPEGDSLPVNCCKAMV